MPVPSLILTRVCDGAAAPEASEVMRQFPPRPRPGAWPTTGLDWEQVSGLLLADPFALDSYGAQRQRAASLRRVLDWLDSQPGAPGRNAGRRRARREPPGGGTWCRAFLTADTGQPAGCCC